jgi:exodeoxyribonuclease VII large subunit
MSKNEPDLFQSYANEAAKKHVYTVTEITGHIKELLAANFNGIWVEGEVSNFRPSNAGHLYFSLKDENAVLSAVIFSRANKEIKFKLEDGLKVICLGTVEVYPPRGQYQIIIEKIEPKGLGSLQLALEQLKKKLEREGLFAAEHKKTIPYLPGRIGVVTSLTGAAIKDILKVLDRRFKDAHIIINPVRVQGEGAKEDIAEAINDFNLFNENLPRDEQVEVLIVGRGGGSIEDLWAFNEETVARAIYGSRIPVISAVGHERDWTIADLVADLRAPTPSVAAELVIPKKDDLSDKVRDLVDSLKRSCLDMALSFEDAAEELMHRLKLNMGHIWQINNNHLLASAKKLSMLNPVSRVELYQTRITDLARQIYIRMSHFIKLKDSEFSGTVENLSSLNPLNILARGYSVTFKMPESRIIKDSKAIKAGDQIRTKVYRGEILSKVTQVN